MERVGHLDNHHSKKCHSAILMEIYKITAKLAVGIDVFVREKGFYRFHNET